MKLLKTSALELISELWGVRNCGDWKQFWEGELLQHCSSITSSSIKIFNKMVSKTKYFTSSLTSSLKIKVKSLSHIWLFVTPWTVTHQAPLSMGFSRQEYWSGLPFPTPGDLPKPGIESGSLSLLFDPCRLNRLFRSQQSTHYQDLSRLKVA